MVVRDTFVGLDLELKVEDVFPFREVYTHGWRKRQLGDICISTSDCVCVWTRGRTFLGPQEGSGDFLGVFAALGSLLLLLSPSADSPAADDGWGETNLRPDLQHFCWRRRGAVEGVGATRETMVGGSFEMLRVGRVRVVVEAGGVVVVGVAAVVRLAVVVGLAGGGGGRRWRGRERESPVVQIFPL